MTVSRNISLFTCIFTPTIATAFYFITFLVFRPASLSGEAIIWWAGLGSVGAGVIGLAIGYRFRHSIGMNYALRWLTALLMLTLVGFAVYRTVLDYQGLHI